MNYLQNELIYHSGNGSISFHSFLLNRGTFSTVKLLDKCSSVVWPIKVVKSDEE